jgi:hypothetical protein
VPRIGKRFFECRAELFPVQRRIFSSAEKKVFPCTGVIIPKAAEESTSQ